MAAMFDEHIEFLKRLLIEQNVEALARGQLALGVLRGDPAVAAPRLGLIPALFEFFEDLLHGSP